MKAFFIFLMLGTAIPVSSSATAPAVAISYSIPVDLVLEAVEDQTGVSFDDLFNDYQDQQTTIEQTGPDTYRVVSGLIPGGGISIIVLEEGI